MMKRKMIKRIKECYCPKCSKKIVVSRPIHRSNPKPIICNSCKFKIENPYEVFSLREQ